MSDLIDRKMVSKSIKSKPSISTLLTKESKQQIYIMCNRGNKSISSKALAKNVKLGNIASILPVKRGNRKTHYKRKRRNNKKTRKL